MQITKLGDIAIEVRSSQKGDKRGCKIVGLEHLTPSEVTISSWSEDSENTFTKEFSKGDVLFGRRRAYLKKASVASFDGICSGDITVIRAKGDKVDSQLLPFIIQNDFFFDYAVEKSAGSLSPRVKWEHLKNFEVNLPDKREQRLLADTLWSINQTKQSYQTLIKQTDELVKSQFVEMFGDESSFEKRPLADSVEEMFIGPFGSALKNEFFVSKENGYCMVYEQKHAIRKTMDVETRYVNKSKYDELKRFSVYGGDIIVSCRGTIGEIYAVPDDAPLGVMHPSIMKIRLKSRVYNKRFFCIALENYMHENNDKANGSGVKMAVTATTLGKELFVVPPLSVQEEYATFVNQVDKSKFAMKDAIDNLDALSKKIIAENLIIKGKGE